MAAISAKVSMPGVEGFVDDRSVAGDPLLVLWEGPIGGLLAVGDDSGIPGPVGA
jgi:hypothetical protein